MTSSNYYLRLAVVGLGTVLAAVLCFFGSFELEGEGYARLSFVAANLGGAFLTSGFVSWWASEIAQREATQRMLEHLEQDETLKANGLQRAVWWDEFKFNWKARAIDCLVIRASSFVGMESANLRTALEDKKRVVRFCVTDPGSAQIPALSAKLGEDEETLRVKIHNVLSELVQTAVQTPAKGHLKVYISRLPMHTSYYRFDEQVNVFFYTMHASGRASIPGVQLRGGDGSRCLSRFFATSFEALIDSEHCDLLFDSRSSASDNAARYARLVTPSKPSVAA